MRAAILLLLLTSIVSVSVARADEPAREAETGDAAATVGTAATTDLEADDDTPRGFYDLSMPLRLYPYGESATIGVGIGAMFRPMLKSCMHLAAELAFERSERQQFGADLDISVFRGALGALWGRGTREGLWLGGGPMIDLGHARVGSGALTTDGFSSTVALRATARLRLKGAAFTHLDLRIGYVVADRIVSTASDSEYGVKGPFLAVAIGASLGP